MKTTEFTTRGTAFSSSSRWAARRLSVLFAAAVALGGCDRPSRLEPEPTHAAPPDTSSPDRREVVSHMRDHFAQVTAVRDAVISGQLQSAREPARWLAEHGAPRAIPDEWIPYVTDLRVMSAPLVDARTVDEMARSLGVVAGTCSGCHEGLSVRIDYLPGMAPVAEDRRGRMQRHLWAMDRLWKGLVFPNELAWQRGAAALAESPFALGDVTADATVGRELLRLSRELQALAPRAREVAKVDRRTVYGDLLTTCSHCHQLAGVKIGRSLEPAPGLAP